MQAANMMPSGGALGQVGSFSWTTDELEVLSARQMDITMAKMRGASYSQIVERFGLSSASQLRSILTRTFMGFHWEQNCDGHTGNISDVDMLSVIRQARCRQDSSLRSRLPLHVDVDGCPPRQISRSEICNGIGTLDGSLIAGPSSLVVCEDDKFPLTDL